MPTTTTAPATTSFEVGATYSCTSACDSDCVWTFTVARRTAKFVTLVDQQTGDTYRVGVKTWDGVEYALPFGSFSMAPSIKADR